MGLVSSSSSRTFSTPISSSKDAAGTTRKRRTQRKPKSDLQEGVTTSQVVGGAIVVGLGAVLFGMVYNSFSR